MHSVFRALQIEAAYVTALQGIDRKMHMLTGTVRAWYEFKA